MHAARLVEQDLTHKSLHCSEKTHLYQQDFRTKKWKGDSYAEAQSCKYFSMYESVIYNEMLQKQNLEVLNVFPLYSLRQ